MKPGTIAKIKKDIIRSLGVSCHNINEVKILDQKYSPDPYWISVMLLSTKGKGIEPLVVRGITHKSKGLIQYGARYQVGNTFYLSKNSLEEVKETNMKSGTGNNDINGMPSRNNYKLPEVSMKTGNFIVVTKQPKYLNLALAKKHGHKK